MTTWVTATVPEYAPSIAAKFNGIADQSKSAIGRIAYRVGRGMPVMEAIKAEAQSKQIDGSGTTLAFRDTTGLVDENDGNRSETVRRGLGILMGLNPQELEAFVAVTRGRPRKVKID